MAESFKIWNFLHNNYLDTHDHVAGALVTSAIFIAGGLAYRLTTAKSKQTAGALAQIPEDELVPAPRFGIRNVVEACAGYVSDRAREIIGPHYVHYSPMLIFVFLWLLVNNLIGILPLFGSPTDNLNTTFSMGIFVFLYYNFQGFRRNGFHYLEQFTGHLKGALLIALGWFMFPLELISHLVRPVTLGIRLRTNIHADHAIYENISESIIEFGHHLGLKLGFIGTAAGWLLASLAPVPLIFLGILVCVVQALVFTLLTSVYISIATAHEEH